MTADDDRIAYLAGDDVAVPEDTRHDLDGLRDLLADPDLWVEPDPLLEDRVVAAIATESATAGGVNPPGAIDPTSPVAPVGLGLVPPSASRPPTATPPPVAPASPSAVLGQGGRARAMASRRWGPKKMAWSAIAVAAVVAAILGGVFALRQGSPSGEHFSIALAPTELAPNASGQASLTKTTSGWRIELDATGLPRLDGGRFYEAWLKNDAGVLVPVGTFNEGTDVTLWAGVSPRDFPSFTVTEEQADGNQASSGQRVLVGTVSLGS